MKYTKRKFFWKSIDNYKKVYVKTWNDSNIDYYAFIKSIVDEGFHQIAVNSEMMVDVISLVAQNLDCSISKIEMMEEDEELKEELQEMIEKTNLNRGAYTALIGRLKELVEESSLEIKRMYIETKLNNIYEDFFIQINGLCGVSKLDTKVENKVTNYIEEYMNR